MGATGARSPTAPRRSWLVRTPESIRDECLRAGYQSPDFRPKHIPADPHLDNAEPGLRELGTHLFSACWEKWMGDALRKHVRKHGIQLSTDERKSVIAEAWFDVCRNWARTTEQRGGRLLVGGAVRHGMLRCESRYLPALLRKRRQAPLAWEDFAEAVDELSPAGRARTEIIRSYSGINDRYYTRTPEEIVIRHAEWDDVRSVLARLPVVQREAAVGRLMGRPQSKTAQLLGVNVKTVQRAEQDVAHVLRSHDWDERSMEGLPVLVIPYEKSA